MTKYDFALMNCTGKKDLQAPVVAILFFLPDFLLLLKIDFEPILLPSRSVTVCYG